MWIFKAAEIPEFKTGGPIADTKNLNKPWKAIHAAADSRTQEMTDLIVRAVDRTKNEVDTRQLLAGFYDKDQTKIEGAVPWQVFEVEMAGATPIMSDTLNEAGENMIPTLPRQYQDVQFDPASPRSLTWAINRGAELVVQITRESTLAIRDAVKYAINTGMGADAAAAQIKPLIGLTQRQAGAVTKFHSKLLEQGVKPQRASKMADTYSKRLLAYRAENIARTELMRSANEGHLQMLYQAADQGILPPTDFTRYWILTPDDRLCPQCAEMKGAEVKLGEDFVTPAGNISGPPLHPMCRCTTGVHFND